MSTYETEHPYQSYDPDFNPDEVMMRLQQLQSRIASTISDVQREDDAIKERQSTIEQEVDLIGLEVFEIDSVTGLKKSRIDIHADQITQRVTYTDYTGSNITSLIVQDAYSINLLASELNLNGLVTFSNLETPGETVIDGGNIYGDFISLGNGVTTSRLEMFTSDTDYHYIMSTRYGAGSTDGSSITGGIRVLAPNGPITLSPNSGTGVYIVGAPLVAKDGLRVVGTSQFDGYTAVNNTLNATVLQESGMQVATQSWVASNLPSDPVTWYSTYNIRRGGATLKFLYGSATLQARNFWDDAYGTFEGLAYSNVSRREEKKDITLFEKNATQLIEETPVYSYLYNSDLDSEPKRVGLIYDEAPMEIMQFTGGIDVYGMASLMWKSLQELNERVKILESGTSV